MRGHVEAAHRGQVPHWSAHRLVRHRDEAHRNLIHCLVRIVQCKSLWNRACLRSQASAQMERQRRMAGNG
eukprot:12932937-Prorocentrum_lima.AAC.1